MKYSPLLYIRGCILAGALCWSLFADPWVQIINLRSSAMEKVPYIQIQDMPYLSLKKLGELFNFTWQWNIDEEMLYCYHGADTLIITPGLDFYRINDISYQAQGQMMYVDDELYVNLSRCIEPFTFFLKEPLIFDDRSKILKKNIALSSPAMEKEVKSSDPVPGQNMGSAGLLTENSGMKLAIKTLVIDPGHGGKDPGAIGPKGVQEKDVVLEIALKLHENLKKKSKLDIFLTRDKDVFIPLGDRTKFANEKKADLFISIHANSISGDKRRKDFVRGYKIYFLSNAKNEDDKLTAMMENSVIELEDKANEGTYLQNILIDMANNEFLLESQELSIFIDQSFEKKLKKIAKLHTGVGQANFWVLNGAYMPSVLVETCFISNPAEEQFLADSAFRSQVALALTDAILNFMNKYKAGL